MKKIIRLTESDLARIVKRVINENFMNSVSFDNRRGINEEMVKQSDGSFISQGYGKDPYQYKAVLVKGTGNWGVTEYNAEYYVARKGSNPKWTKITDKSAMDKIQRQQFGGLGTDFSSHGTSDDYYISDTSDINKGRVDKPYKAQSRGGSLRAFAEIFPCVEQAMKPTDKKIISGELPVFEIDGVRYTVRKDPSAKKGWTLSGYDPTKRDNANTFYQSCEEFKKRKK